MRPAAVSHGADGAEHAPLLAPRGESKPGWSRPAKIVAACAVAGVAGVAALATFATPGSVVSLASIGGWSPAALGTPESRAMHEADESHATSHEGDPEHYYVRGALMVGGPTGLNEEARTVIAHAVCRIAHCDPDEVHVETVDGHRNDWLFAKFHHKSKGNNGKDGTKGDVYVPMEYLDKPPDREEKHDGKAPLNVHWRATFEDLHEAESAIESLNEYLAEALTVPRGAHLDAVAIFPTVYTDDEEGEPLLTSHDADDFDKDHWPAKYYHEGQDLEEEEAEDVPDVKEHGYEGEGTDDDDTPEDDSD